MIRALLAVLVITRGVAGAQGWVPVADSAPAAAEAPAAAPAQARAFWNLRPIQETSLLGAIEDFGRRTDDDRILRSRGYLRGLNFRYRSFTYERDSFHVYKGFRLRSFLDGRLDLGLYKHHLQRGMMFGPAGAYLPSGSNKIELTFPWLDASHESKSGSAGTLPGTVPTRADFIDRKAPGDR